MATFSPYPEPEGFSCQRWRDSRKIEFLILEKDGRTCIQPRNRKAKRIAYTVRRQSGVHCSRPRPWRLERNKFPLRAKTKDSYVLISLRGERKFGKMAIKLNIQRISQYHL